MQCLLYAENPKCLDITAKSQISFTQVLITKHRNHLHASLKFTSKARVQIPRGRALW